MSKVLRYDEQGNAVWVDKSALPEQKTPRPIVSELGLGCIADAVGEMRADAALHGFTGVEWKPDPKLVMDGEPLWYDAHFSDPDQHARYVEHRGMSDRNSRNGGGAVITSEHLSAMSERMKRKYHKKDA
jgi:hypothetical protein